MKPRAARFTQSDITRAIAGAAKAGVMVAVEITLDGTLRLIPVEARPAVPQPKDELMKRIGNFK